MTLAEFLTARLDEDEAFAKAATPLDLPEYWERVCVDMATEDEDHYRRYCPARVLREVQAKRKILAEIWQYEAKIDSEWGDCHGAEAIAAGKCPEIDPDSIAAVRAMASVYSDHEQFNDAWRA